MATRTTATATATATARDITDRCCTVAGFPGCRAPTAPVRGRNAPNAQSFITLKTEVLTAPLGIQPRSPRYQIARNLFLNWQGRNDQAFIQLGEDTNAQNMITDALIENNLFIGNSTSQMAAPIQLKGPRNITVRANTAVGFFQNTTTVAFRIGTEGSNLPVQDIFVYNNIWTNGSGTMPPRFINAYGSVVLSSIVLDNNLVWNGSGPIPSQGSVPLAIDAHLTHGDPAINQDQAALLLPVYDEKTFQFPSKNLSIRQEFERLVETYGAIHSGSAALDRANAARMPAEDILQRPRAGAPDMGAYEVQQGRPQAPAGLRVVPW